MLRVAFENPQMVVTLLGPTKRGKLVGHQDAAVEELAERTWQETAYRGVTCTGSPMGGRMGGHLKQSNSNIYHQHVLRLLVSKY